MVDIRTQYEVRRPFGCELHGVQRLRHAVLDPAKLEPTELDLSSRDYDSQNILLAAILNPGREVISTGRLDLVEPGKFLVRKMATHPDYQGQGLGSEVLAGAIMLAAAERGAEFTVYSRDASRPFYARNGFVETGIVVEHNAGIPNFEMTMQVA